MYKIPKKTIVDLNTTKIYLLKIHKRKHDIAVKIVFSVNNKDDYYKSFIRETLTYAKPNTSLFKLEDYTQYLADSCEYDLIEDKETMLFTPLPKEDIGYSRLYLVPSPHLNLLEQHVEDLIEYQNPKLTLLPTGLFLYHEYVDNSNSTKGILKDLIRFKNNKKVHTNTTKECWLLNSIKALDLYWN